MLLGWVIYAINRAQVRRSAARPTVYAAPLDAEIPLRQLRASHRKTYRHRSGRRLAMLAPSASALPKTATTSDPLVSVD
jgi:hypothetical protein